jgi:hypothetical protein
MRLLLGVFLVSVTLGMIHHRLVHPDPATNSIADALCCVAAVDAYRILTGKRES